jgi:hypothetical protein
MMAGKNQFRSLKQGQGKSKRQWWCAACRTSHSEKVKQCGRCFGTDILYFASLPEMARFAELSLMQDHGLISHLENQPEYKIILNGILVFTYRADTRYVKENGQIVIEDVKGSINPKALDPVFKLKKKTVEAYYGITITIHVRK